MTSRTRRYLAIAAGWLLGFVILLPLALVLVFRSGWFHDKVRDRIVAEVEKASGGRAEIGAFQFDWRKLEARVAPFTLHGKEKPGEPVFLQTAGIQIGLKIVSAMKRDIDIESLIVDRPQVHVLFYSDGSTNVPGPRVKRRDVNFVEQILKIAAHHFELRNGVAEVRDDRIPLDIRGDDLLAVFDYDFTGPRYRGHVSSRQLHWESRYVRPVAFDFDSDLVLEKDQLQIAKASFVTGRSHVNAQGSFHNWKDPQVDVTFDSDVLMGELAKIVNVPLQPEGTATAHGRAVLSWSKGFQYSIDGHVVARGLEYKDKYVHVAGIGARGDFRLSPDGVVMPRLSAAALGGTFEGRVELKDKFEKVEVEGRTQNIAIDQLTRATAQPKLAWSGVASGPVKVDGRIGPGRPHDFTAVATMNVEQAPGPHPIQGNAGLAYDQRAGALRLTNVDLSTQASRITVSGTLGQTLQASVKTKNLDDLLPGLAMLSPDAPKQLPIAVTGGEASANVTVTGALASPVISGNVRLGPFKAHEQSFDSLASDVTLSANELTARNVEISQGELRITGTGRIELRTWKAVDGSAVSAAINLRGGDVEKLLAEAGQKLPVTGTLIVTADVSGTYASPLAALKLTVEHPSAYGETFDQLRADARVTNTAVQVSSADLQIGRGHVRFTGSYNRTGADWAVGAVRFDVAGDGITLDQFQHVREYKTGLSAMVALRASGTAHTRKATVDLDSLDSQLTLGGMTRRGAPIGNISAIAKTRGDTLDAQISGAIRGSSIGASGQWKLEGDYPGRFEVQFTPITFANLHQMLAQGPVENELPFMGQLEGRATVTGPLKKPDALQAVIVFPHIEMKSDPAHPMRAGTNGQDLVLRNTEPVQMTATLKAINIQSAKFSATNTSLEASGRVTFDAQSPWNAALKGNVNLGIVRLFNSDISAQGNALVDTTIRGALNDPQVNGRLELKGASLYLADIPQGVDNANGVITFDRNRANIEKLTAEVGGGRAAFQGFVGFGGGVLLYRVQGNADQVRLRHPDGASVTLNAALNLTGTSQNGLVSGTVTVMRAAFEPRSDLGSLLAQSAKPLPAPAAPSEFLRGLNFDVRIESGPSLTVQTTLTRDLEAEAEMRLRGNAARPLLTGDISVNQGEVQFFGNKYSINRGEIRFINPTKIEPIFDIDLETKARGITVNISFSGTLNKLNLTYRSDPPLQSNDIIALLAVGRDPTNSAVANAQTRTNLLDTSGSTLGQAVAAPVSSRLQRFFGVSRLKIDPQLTGVENIPQARLTLEQQVSRDITLTYITNLTRTQEQIVRIQWDINRQWSAIAVREENGVFGIDFQYRKRFR